MAEHLHDFTLAGVLQEHARGRTNHPAIIDDGARYTYKEMLERVTRLANAFEAQGIGRGDRILWLAQNSYRVLECLCAASMLGAMLCPANWRQSAEELAFVIDDFSPKLIFWQDEEIGTAVREARKTASWTSALWLQHDAPDNDEYEALIASGSPADTSRPSAPNAPALVIYTAAFTGTPNGAMLNQTGLITHSLLVQYIQSVSPDTIYLNSGPMFHVGTLMNTFATFTCGGTNVFVRRTDAKKLCQIIHETRCNFAFLIPKVCEDIVRENADGRYDLKCLQSPSFFPEWDKMVTINPRDGRNGPYGYGQTELNGFVVWTFYGLPGDTGVNGRAAPGHQIRIVDDQDNEMSPGEIGEIVARGPSVMCGYWNRPELNTQRHRGGWHHTNDLGRRERDGSLSFIGPKTKMIKSGVENIYPAEVEGCLRKHPAVADAAIIGIPDEVFVQSVKAIVQLRPDANITAADLIEHCRAHLASYKKPRFVEFVDALPRTKNGIIDYAALDERHGGGNYPGQAWQASKRA